MDLFLLKDGEELTRLFMDDEYPIPSSLSSSTVPESFCNSPTSPTTPSPFHPFHFGYGATSNNILPFNFQEGEKETKEEETTPNTLFNGEFFEGENLWNSEPWLPAYTFGINSNLFDSKMRPLFPETLKEKEKEASFPNLNDTELTQTTEKENGNGNEKGKEIFIPPPLEPLQYGIFTPPTILISSLPSFDLPNSHGHNHSHSHPHNHRQKRQTKEGIIKKKTSSNPSSNSGGSNSRHIDRKDHKYTCKDCKLRFKTFTKLRYHSYTHSGDYPFVCEECGKGFPVKSAFVRHKARHLGVKAFVCPICDKAFVEVYDLRRHEKSHLRRMRCRR